MHSTVHLDHRPLQLYRVAIEGQLFVVAPDEHAAEELAARHVCDEHHGFLLSPFLVHTEQRGSIPRAALAAVPWGDPGRPSRTVSGWLEEMASIDHEAAAAAEVERVQVKFPFAVR